METSTNKLSTILIVGAGVGGLSLYQSIRKNLGQKFNVKIFERENGPEERWQGNNINMQRKGVTSLFYCTPPEVQARFPEAMPDPIPKEHHTVAIIDHLGSQLIHIPQPKFKSVYEIESLKHDFASIVTYRYRLRDVLLEGVDIQWGKKFIGYEESEDGVWALFEDGTREFGDLLIGSDGINSPIRKQKVPNLEIFNLGITSVDVDIAMSKDLADKMASFYSNSLMQKSIGQNGDSFFSLMRLVPIEKSDEPRYMLSLAYHYPTILDIEDENCKVDDDNPESVIKHTISRIKQLRPPCELTDLMIELFSLVPYSDPGKKNLFRAYNPPRRRPLRDIDPLSVPPWKDDRIILLGDAAHAMNPILGLGANNAIQDAELLTKELLKYENDNLIECIRQYNTKMRARASKDLQASRTTALRQRASVGGFGLFARYYMLRAINAFINVTVFIQTRT
ncbi:FAD/NADP-binding domain-containing protein [Gigaspora margarita]|uniref:FAD/NADP-binding domain-containing protein n=1 Tax=Gigaspora margarita TaxID=4874 RepID=A0A8H4EJJ8_GIGMA|nr:FAD/NADP-binding domain-containing protein [Gigaspora margarita]